MKTKLSVWGQHGSISLVESPKHLYRNVIMEAALHGTIAELHRRRPHLAPVQNIDWHLTSMLWRKKNTEIGPGASQRHLLAMAAGGHWRQTHLKAIDPSESDNCILCGQGRDDEEHLWTCTALQQVRSKHERAIRCQEHLPTQLKRYGIAPHISTDPQLSFWGTPVRTETLSRADAKWLG